MANNHMKNYFVPRSLLGRQIDNLYDVQEQCIDGTWRTVLPTNDRMQAISRAASLENAGGRVRIVDNSK